MVAYADDWIAWAPSRDACMEAAEEFVSFLQSLGFQIDVRKSRLVPPRVSQWLGLDWDLVSHRFFLPASKRQEIA